MATTIVRRKRSRNEFDAENIDLIGIGNVGSSHPRKKARRTITTPSKTLKISNKTNKSKTSTQARKRSYSQTDFSKNFNDFLVLKECSPNKKIKIVNHSTRMMVDNGESSNGEKTTIKIDDEGDVSMGPTKKIKQIKQHQLFILILYLDQDEGISRNTHQTEFVDLGLHFV
eukprot:UN01213